MLVLWLALWLPLAGTMAAVMPVTSHLDSRAGIAAVEAAMAAVPAGMSVPCHPSGGTNQPTCDQCELCHIAGSLLPVTFSRGACAETRDAVPVGRHTAFTSHIPEQPHRPPLAPA